MGSLFSPDAGYEVKRRFGAPDFHHAGSLSYLTRICDAGGATSQFRLVCFSTTTADPFSFD